MRSGTRAKLMQYLATFVLLSLHAPDAGAGNNTKLKTPPVAGAVPAWVMERITNEKCENRPAMLGDSRTTLIFGNFDQDKTTDWAAMCYRRHKLSVVVLWEDTQKGDRCSSKVMEMPLADEGVHPPADMAPADVIWIETVSGEQIQSIPRNYDVRSPPPPTFDHDGIEIGSRDKGVSSFYYCHDRRWIMLEGGD